MPRNSDRASDRCRCPSAQQAASGDETYIIQNLLSSLPTGPWDPAYLCHCCCVQDDEVLVQLQERQYLSAPAHELATSGDVRERFARQGLAIIPVRGDAVVEPSRMSGATATNDARSLPGGYSFDVLPIKDLYTFWRKTLSLLVQDACASQQRNPADDLPEYLGISNTTISARGSIEACDRSHSSVPSWLYHLRPGYPCSSGE